MSIQFLSILVKHSFDSMILFLLALARVRIRNLTRKIEQSEGKGKFKPPCEKKGKCSCMEMDSLQIFGADRIELNRQGN